MQSTQCGMLDRRITFGSTDTKIFHDLANSFFIITLFMIDKFKIEQSLLFNIYNSFIYIFLTLILFWSFNSNLKAREIFILDNQTKNNIVHSKFIEFLEDFDEKTTLKQLQNSEWTSTLSSHQAFVQGYWTRTHVFNKLPTTDIGIKHNLNFEKKIILDNSLDKREYLYWRYGKDPYLTDINMGGDFKLVLPKNETTIIYNYFRSKPFNRYYSANNGLDRIRFTTWNELKNAGIINFLGAICFVAISFAFALYYSLIYFVSKGNYIWLCLILFLSSTIVFITYPTGFYFDFSLYYTFSGIELSFFSLLFILLLQFFRKILQLNESHPRINKMFISGIIIYSVLFSIYLIESFRWPEGELFNNLLKHPPDNQGAGFIPLPFMVIPFSILLITVIIISFLRWRKGDATAGYLCLSFSLPFLLLPMYGIFFIFELFGTATSFMVAISRALFLAMFITFGLAVAQRMNDLEKFAMEQQIRLTEAYQRFVPKQLLSNLKKDSILDVKLGDQVQKEMSILFSDIRSFTTLSESMTPEQNFKFVNSYLKQMGPLVRENNGYIDKFIGDAIMALFDRSPGDAVKTAVIMLRTLSEYNAGRKRAGYNPIKIGIGVNTGIMMLGTVGESDRMEGSVISDAVNLAARLEGLTKLYQTPLLISETTMQHLHKDHFTTRLIDRVSVKGKSDPILVYEVLDAESKNNKEKKILKLSNFNQAYDLYQKQNFEKALIKFSECFKYIDEDTVSKLYIERCKNLISNGWDPQTWDGINYMDTK